MSMADSFQKAIPLVQPVDPRSVPSFCSSVVRQAQCRWPVSRVSDLYTTLVALDYKETLPYLRGEIWGLRNSEGKALRQQARRQSLLISWQKERLKEPFARIVVQSSSPQGPTAQNASQRTWTGSKCTRKENLRHLPLPIMHRLASRETLPTPWVLWTLAMA